MNAAAHPAEFILPSTEVTVCGARLRAARFPNGVINTSRAMLCVPGYAAAGESFARLRPVAKESDVRLLTLPDEGWRHADPIEHFGEMLAAFAQHFDHPVLLGTSFGGLVAIEAARGLGSQISGLVLISTFAAIPSGRRWLRVAAPLVPLIEYAGAHLQSVGIRFLGGAKIDNAASLELRRETNAIDKREKHSRLMAALRFDARETISRIAVPTLIIHGSDDHLVPVATARELAALLPHAQLVAIANAGHLPYLTHPEEVSTALSRFLGHAFQVEHHGAAHGQRCPVC